jgi:NAD(P)-dependent dehydrogenase (short-subunit alcohol dehydrogenase family)
MTDRLKGRVAAVTGAGQGIGRAVALALAAEGASVVVNDSAASADSVAKEIVKRGGQAIPNSDSVATVEGGEKIVKAAVDTFGRIDIVVNAAGIARDGDILEMTEADWDEVIAVNLKGVYCVSKAAAMQMRRQRYGRIINLTSADGLIGTAGRANFAASRAGAAGFTRVLAREMGRNAITVNAVAPAEEDDPALITPMIVYLATEDAWNVNGKVFYVSAGSVALAYDEEMGRAINKNGMWTVEELARLVPLGVLAGVANPAPAGTPAPSPASAP